MYKNFSLLFFFLISFVFYSFAQTTYSDSIRNFQKKYVDTHQVVEKADKKYIEFYLPDVTYRVVANFKRIKDNTGFDMSTSSGKKSHYFIYGLLNFSIHDTATQLYVYQSQELMKVQEYKEYLFVPFGDATSGITTYGGGRYLDFIFTDIRNNQLLLDFNKTYNPYCAYVSGYNCPIPPKENLLKIFIPGGEKNYGKPYH